MQIMAAVDICTNEYAPVWNIVGFVVNVIRIGIPIVLILFGMIDLTKAVIANKEDEVKKATKLLGKRFLYAVGVFASVWIVTFVLDLAAGTIGKNNSDYKYDESSWKKCWALINGDDVDGVIQENNNAAEKACYMIKNRTGEIYSWEEKDKVNGKDGYTLIPGINSPGDCNKKNEGISIQ